MKRAGGGSRDEFPRSSGQNNAGNDNQRRRNKVSGKFDNCFRVEFP
jgi:hypothetical protein